MSIESGSPTTSPSPIDHVYELNKADVDDPKDAVRQTGPGTFEYQLFRTFVHGLEFIDELVFMSDQWAFYYPIQDANYNVIAYEGLEISCEYDPYGRMRIREQWNSNGTWIDHEYNPSAPTSFYDLPGFQGRLQDRETGLYNFRNRDLALPPVGRWLQADPNGTGLTVTSGTRYHGEMPRPSPWVRPKSQFTDGANLYQLLSGNPITQRDPAGLFSFADLGATSSIRSDMLGQELDMGTSIVDAMRGVVFMANDRNAEMDIFLGMQSSPFDTSEIDEALALNDSFQKVRTALTAGGIAVGVLKIGAKLWQKFVRRAGGRGNLLTKLDEGIESQRSLFGFQGKYWNKRITFSGKRVYQRDDLINPKFVGPDGRTNLQRMRDGNAPVGPDGKSVNLHHLTQLDDSPLAEVTSTWHTENRRALHINPRTLPSGIDRTSFDEWRKQYWKARAGVLD